MHPATALAGCLWRMADTAQVETQKFMQVAQHWYASKRVNEVLTWIWEPHASRYLTGNIWLAEGAGECLLIDTGSGVRPLRPFIETLTSESVTAIALNCFYDHASGLHEFDQRCAHVDDELAILNPNGNSSAADAYLTNDMFQQLPVENFDVSEYKLRPASLTQTLQDGDRFAFDNLCFEIVHTPGVTPGSCCVFESSRGWLFTSDTYFYDANAPGPSGRQSDAYRQFLKKLLDLPVDQVYPGHFDPVNGDQLWNWIDNYLSKNT